MGHDVVPYLAVDDVEGTAQPDPSASLGGNRSSTVVYDVQSTLTSNQVDARRVVDTARIGDGVDAHVGKWMLFMTGAAALHASPVTAFDTATGEFLLRDGTPSLASSGDTYRLHDANEFWDDLDGTDSALGNQHYRLLYLHNETGSSLTTRRVSMRFLHPSGVDFLVAEWDGTADQQGITVIADEETAPDLTELQATPANFQVPRFERPVPDGTFLEVPRGGTRGHAIGAAIPVWLTRIVGSSRAESDPVVLQLIHEYANTGGDPDPLVTSMLIVFSVGGLTRNIAFSRDRKLRVGGGARYTVRVTAQESGLPVGGEDVDFDQTAGPGTLSFPSDPLDRRTDSNGESFASYASSTDEADEGQTVTVRGKV